MSDATKELLMKAFTRGALLPGEAQVPGTEHHPVLESLLDALTVESGTMATAWVLADWLEENGRGEAAELVRQFSSHHAIRQRFKDLRSCQRLGKSRLGWAQHGARWAVLSLFSWHASARGGMDAVNDFVRAKMREDGFYRRIMPPLLTNDVELDRPVQTDGPFKVFD